MHALQHSELRHRHVAGERLLLPVARGTRGAGWCQAMRLIAGAHSPSMLLSRHTCFPAPLPGVQTFRGTSWRP